MPYKFNPFSGTLDQTGSGGGGSSYIDGEVQNFSALPETVGSPAVDSAYLVREAEGAWLLARKPAGIYIRTADTGTRADDWTYAGAFPDVFNDANFLLYDNGDSTKNLQFQLSGIATGQTRTITMPNANVTLPDQGTSTGDTPTFAKVTINDTVNDLSTLTLANDTGGNNIEFETQELTLRHTGTNDTPYINVTDGTDYALLGVRQGDMFLQGSNAVVRIEQSGGVLADIKVNKLVLEDATSSGEPTATFDADGNLTDNRTYDLPNANGTLALTSDFAAPPAIGNTTPSTGAFTTLSATPAAGSTALTLTGGTVTASAPVLDASQTWNNGAVTFTGLRVNVTNTASDHRSSLLSIDDNGTPAFGVQNLIGHPANQVVRIFGGSRGLLFSPRNTATNGGTDFFALRWQLNQISMVHGTEFGWSQNPFQNAPDLSLHRDAADTLAQRRSTNAQTFRLYNTFTSTTNFERLNIIAQLNGSVIIGTEKGSAGGTARALEFQTDGTTRGGFTDSGAFYIGTSASFTSTGLQIQPTSNRGGLFFSNCSVDVSSSTVTIRGGSNSTDWIRVSSGLLLFQGTTTSFPALKRSGTVLQARLANDSDFCPLQGQLRTHANAVTETITADKTLTLYDAAGTAYKVPCVAA